VGFYAELNSPWVPEDRSHLYAKGFHAGFYGDWPVASHLLIPQIEHSIRYILMQHGVIPSSIDMSGIQNEYDLNATLRWPELEEVLGNDIVFDLQAILISRFGSNMRNRMAHGLIGDYGFYSHEAIYLWWLTLRLCCWPLIVSEMQHQNNHVGKEQEEEENGGHDEVDND